MKFTPDPREYTAEEIRRKFLNFVEENIDYLKTAHDEKTDHPLTSEQAMERLIHSILLMMDGGGGDLPGFAIVPIPHQNDMNHRKSHKMDWYPFNDIASWPMKGEIGGDLHEDWRARILRRRRQENP